VQLEGLAKICTKLEAPGTMTLNTTIRKREFHIFLALLFGHFIDWTLLGVTKINQGSHIWKVLKARIQMRHFIDCRCNKNK